MACRRGSASSSTQEQATGVLGEHVDLNVGAALVAIEEGLFAGLGSVQRGRGRVRADLDAFGLGGLAHREGE